MMRFKKEFASNDPNVVFSYNPFQDDMERRVEMCSLVMFLLQTVNMNDKVIIIPDTRHTQRWSERKVDPRLWVHERTPGVPRNVENLETVEFADVLGAIAEDYHLTRCAQACFTGTEEDQAARHDHGTSDDVFGDQDMEEGGDVLDEADREADFCLVTQSPRKSV